MSDARTQRMLILNGNELVDYSVPTPAIWGAGGSGGGSAYWLIAGSDAPADVIAEADATCDGTADQVQINEALATDDDRPILLAGTFFTSAAIAYSDGVRHDLLGWGQEGAVIQANHTGNALEVHSAQLPQEWRCRIENLKITKGTSIPARGLSITNGAFLTVRNVIVDNIDTGRALYGYFSNTNIFENCTFSDSTYGAELTGAANQGSHFNTFRSCFFRANDYGIKLTTRAQMNHWEDCTFDYSAATDLAVQVIGTDECDGNHWTACWFEGGNSSGALDLQGADDLRFEGCRFAPGTTSWPIVKVSGFGATNVVIRDPVVSNPACWATLPAAVTLVHTGNQRVANVLNFGAVGDGVTDDAAAIQRAVTHLGTTGGTITGPLGTYLLSNQGNVGHDSLSSLDYCLRVTPSHGPITFDFPRGTVFKLASSQPDNSVLLCVDGQSASRRTSPTTIRGITFDGNSDGSQTAWDDFGLVTSVYADDVLIQGCTFKAYNFACVHILRDTRGARIRDCFFDATYAGLTPPSEGTRPMLRIEVQDLVVDGNRFITHFNDGQHAISMGDNADIDMQGVGMRITNNLFAGGRNGPMLDLAGVTHCVVAHNFFRDNGDTSGYCIGLAQYTNANGTFWEGAWNIVAENTFMNVRQAVQLSGNATTLAGTNYTTGAFGNIVRDNLITRDFTDLRTQIGVGDTYPDRFSPCSGTPAAVTMNVAILESGQVKSSNGHTGQGTASAATGTTISDSSKNWTSSAFVNFMVVLVDGTGKGQARIITANTATQLTVAAWDVTPDTTTKYVVTNLVGYNEISGNVIVTTGTSGKGVQSTGWLPSTFKENRVYGTTAANAFQFGDVAGQTNNPNAIYTGNKAYANGPGIAAPQTHLLYQDENAGTGTIASGATSATITHKLGRTPLAAQIRITPTNNPTNDPGIFWVDTIGATTFAVNCRADPGAGGATFAWAVVGSA